MVTASRPNITSPATTIRIQPTIFPTMPKRDGSSREVACGISERVVISILVMFSIAAIAPYRQLRDAVEGLEVPRQREVRRLVLQGARCVLRDSDADDEIARRLRCDSAARRQLAATQRDLEHEAGAVAGVVRREVEERSGGRCRARPRGRPGVPAFLGRREARVRLLLDVERVAAAAAWVATARI